MNTKTFFIKDDYSEIAKFLQNEKVVFLGGETALIKTMEKLECFLTDIDYTTLVYGKECTHEIIQKWANDPVISNCTVMVGVGGGKAIDTAKAVAKQASKKIYTLATIASTCAATSSVSVVYTDEHKYLDVIELDVPPLICFIPLEIIAEAPVHFMWAGIGDTLAKPVEMNMTLRHREQTVVMQLALNITQLCLSECMTYGKEALASNQKKEVTLPLEHSAYAIIANTGFASSLMPLRYGTSLAHSIHNALTHFKPIKEHHHIHGEIVAYGILVLLNMDHQVDLHDKLTSFYKTIGLPTKLKDLDMNNDLETLDLLIKKTLEDEFLVESCYEMTFEMVKEAMIHQEA